MGKKGAMGRRKRKNQKKEMEMEGNRRVMKTKRKTRWRTPDRREWRQKTKRGRSKEEDEKRNCEQREQ